MFCLWKYKKSTLKFGILYQNWRNFPSCTDCPSSPKLQIRFINLAVDLSLYYLFQRQVYYLVGWVLSAPLIGIVLLNLSICTTNWSTCPFTFHRPLEHTAKLVVWSKRSALSESQTVTWNQGLCVILKGLFQELILLY